MIGPVLQSHELRAIAGLSPRASLAKLERWAKSCGIGYKYDAKGGIWTTQAAMDAAVGVRPASNDDDGKLRPDELF